MAGMGDFYTRERANEGIKLPLALPDGTETEHYLVIRGIDSDAFRTAEAEAKRKAMQLAALEDDTTRAVAMENERNVLVASLVSGWSFESECTLESVREFLREAPQISDQIDQIATKRSLFFNGKSKSSASSRKRKSV